MRSFTKTVTDICDEIVKLPVSNIADLALLARAVALYSSEYWTDGDAYVDRGLMPLVGAVCKLAGVEAMPGYREIREGKAAA
jgi:hypothetical protein